MAAPNPLLRNQISFAVAGLLFGGLVGFIIAFELFSGRMAVPGRTGPGAPPAAAQPMGAGTGQGRQGQAGQAQGPAGEAAGAPSMDSMEQVTRELEALRRMLQEDPRNLAALRRMAGLYMDAAMYDRAMEFLRQAVDIDPADVHTLTDLGTCLYMVGRPDEALAHFKDAIGRDPSHPKPWYSMGLAYVEAGDYQKGEEAFAEALRLSPGAFDMNELRAEIEKVKAQRSGKAGSPS